MDGTAAAEVDPRVYRDALEDVRRRVDGPDLKQPVETLLTRGFAAEGIIEAAKEVGCDLIVMGTHGRTGLSQALDGKRGRARFAQGSLPGADRKGCQGHLRTDLGQTCRAGSERKLKTRF